MPDYYVECKPKSMCLYINRNFLKSQKPNPITTDDEASFMLSEMTEDTNGIPCSPWSIDVADNVPLNQDPGFNLVQIVLYNNFKWAWLR